MELDINAYLSGLLLKYNTYQPSKSEVKEIEKDLVGFILRKIIRKKFRKGKLYPNTQKTIYEKVSFRVSISLSHSGDTNIFGIPLTLNQIGQNFLILNF